MYREIAAIWNRNKNRIGSTQYETDSVTRIEGQIQVKTKQLAGASS